MIEQSPKNNTVLLKINLKFVVIALLIINMATLVLWKPWSNTSTARKITVSGQATVKSTPDEYVLSPYFEFTNADRTKATAELTTQSTAITAKLKELGVKDEQIKSNTNGYDRYYGYGQTDNSANALQLQYTITLSNKDTTQKVQDYLLTLKPKGQISPLATFSEEKSKSLQDEARTKAIDDAKAKATKTAQQFNAKVGKVVNVSEGNNYGCQGGLCAGSALTMESKADASVSSVPIQSGKDEFSYSVTVEYELR